MTCEKSWNILTNAAVRNGTVTPTLSALAPSFPKTDETQNWTATGKKTPSMTQLTLLPKIVLHFRGWLGVPQYSQGQIFFSAPFDAQRFIISGHSTHLYTIVLGFRENPQDNPTFHGKNLGVATFFLKSFSWDCPEMNSTLKICEFHTKNEQKKP